MMSYENTIGDVIRHDKAADRDGPSMCTESSGGFNFDRKKFIQPLVGLLLAIECDLAGSLAAKYTRTGGANLAWAES